MKFRANGFRPYGFRRRRFRPDGNMTYNVNVEHVLDLSDQDSDITATAIVQEISFSDSVNIGATINISVVDNLTFLDYAAAYVRGKLPTTELERSRGTHWPVSGDPENPEPTDGKFTIEFD